MHQSRSAPHPTNGQQRPRRERIRAARAPLPPRLDRRAALSRLLPLWPHELEDESPQARLHVIGRLRKALRAERRRGLAGHWTYDLARHIELLRLYRAELAALSAARGSASAAAIGRTR